jgi:hypothetical protein
VLSPSSRTQLCFTFEIRGKYMKEDRLEGETEKKQRKENDRKIKN